MHRTRAKKARESKRTAAVPKPLTPAQSTAVRQIVKQTADLKYTDFQDSVSVTTTGHLFALVGNLTRGDLGLNNLDGNNLTPVGLTVRYYWTTSIIHNAVRVLVFQWNDFSTPTMDAIYTGWLHSMHEIGNKMNFRILHDEFFVLAPTTPGTDNAIIKYSSQDLD